MSKPIKHATFRRGKVTIQVAFNRISVSIYDIHKVLAGKLPIGKVTVVLPPSDERKLGSKGRLLHDIDDKSLHEIVSAQLRNDVATREQYATKLRELLALDEETLRKSKSIAKAWAKRR